MQHDIQAITKSLKGNYYQRAVTLRLLLCDDGAKLILVDLAKSTDGLLRQDVQDFLRESNHPQAMDVLSIANATSHVLNTQEGTQS